MQNVGALVCEEVDRTNNEKTAQNSIYVRFETDYLVEPNCKDTKTHPSYRFIRDFEIKDFKVKIENMIKNI